MAVVETMDVAQETRTLPYPVYDADGHIYETEDTFRRHLPREYHKDFQYVQIEGRTKLAIGGHISDYIPNPLPPPVATKPGIALKIMKGLAYANSPETRCVTSRNSAIPARALSCWISRISMPS
jgi:hypothetical protein